MILNNGNISTQYPRLSMYRRDECYRWYIEAGDERLGQGFSLVSDYWSSRPPLRMGAGSLARDEAALRYFFKAANGPGWTRKDGWGTRAPISSWYGVHVIGDRVVKIELTNNNMRGASWIRPCQTRSSRVFTTQHRAHLL